MAMRGAAGAGMAFTNGCHCERSEAISRRVLLTRGRLLRRYAPRNDGVRLPPEWVIDDRFLLRGQGLVQRLDRRAALRQPLYPRREELLAVALPVEHCW